MLRHLRIALLLLASFPAWGFNTLITTSSMDRYQMMSNVGIPSAVQRYGYAFTGTKFLIYGGGNANYSVFYNSGSVYDIATNAWSPMATAGSPGTLTGMFSAWTGTELLLWGGWNGSTNVASGWRYNPATKTWASMAASGLTGRNVFYLGDNWSGTQAFFWGGYTNETTQFNNGGLYNPANNTWSSITVTGAPQARDAYCVTWTGTHFFVWGGWNNGSLLNSGGLYNPTTNTWTTVAASPLSGRTAPACTWTGSKIVVFAGGGASSLLNDGAVYDPVANTWSTMAASQAGLGSCVALWTGTEVFYTSGLGVGTTPGVNWKAAYYNPTTNKWRASDATGSIVTSAGRGVINGNTVYFYGNAGGGAAVMMKANLANP